MAVQIRSVRQSKRFQAMKLLRYHRDRSVDMHINVTALVDMMTVLVIFLLMQFNVSGQILFISKDLRVPKAVHVLEIAKGPLIALTRAGDLYFEGQLTKTKLTAPTAANRWEIAELADALRASHMSDVVNVQIDQNVDYSLIKRVLHTCESAGYRRIHLSVGDGRQDRKI